MSASQPHQAVSDRIVRERGDPRQGGRVDLPARLTPRGEVPGVRQEARRSYVLVVAMDVVVPTGLAHADVLVVAPALNSWLRHWLSDEDPARGRAEKRVAALVERLQGTAAHVEGRVGDADPLQATADALATFPADEIVISARPERSIDQIDDLVSRVRERFALPVSWTGLSKPIAA